MAQAFTILRDSGKVRHFVVSDPTPSQIALLPKYLPFPISVNQLQLSITNCTMISSSINVNMENESAVDRDGGILDYCRLNDITIQAWSPFQYGNFSGVFLGNEKFPELNRKIDEVAEKYGVTNTTIALAWILRHPARIQPITGTWNLERFNQCCKAADITLTRGEWYDIYHAAGNKLP